MPALPLKALAFDIFGTVVDWRTSIIREGRALGENKGINADWEALADAWRGKYQPAMERVRRGERPWAKLDVLHREGLDELLVQFGITGLSEEEIADFNCAWHRLDPWPDTVAGLTRLRKKFLLATLSNGNVALLVNMAKHAGLPWDAILGAEVARHYKPQPEAYLVTAELLDCAPEQCLLVAAHNKDLVTGARLGMKTAFVARPSEYGPHQSQDFKAEHDFDYVAKDFLDLADQLGC